MSIRVLLADDQAMIRAGFAMILAAHDDIEIAGEAADGDEAVHQAQVLQPDVVVMDIQMPNRDGIAATQDILTDPGTSPKILIVTTFDFDEYVYGALRAGASGFLLKNAPPEELVHAVRVVASGEALVSPSITRRLIEHFCNQPDSAHTPARFDMLTAREHDVLRLLAQGLSNSQIAEHLVIGHGTVKTHVARILMKLGLTDRVQAVVLAYETGLVAPSTRRA
jgi:DNA-binding NarL/FixJ family response regulator